MKTAINLFAAGLLLASAASGLADVHYVDVNSTNATPPYLSWVTAATNIQVAVDSSVAGDEIVVTNGIYATGGRTVDGVTTHRVAVDKPLALRSVNGPQSTIIDGGQLNGCAYLTDGASLSGFTLTNGRAPVGGGLWCESTNAVVSNCVVSGNSSFGGGADRRIGAPCCYAGYRTEQTAFAGGVYGGTVNNCILEGNWAADYATAGHCDLSTCTISSCCGEQFSGSGGGAAYAILNNCTLTSNSAGYGGGAFGCTLNNCTLSGNSVVYAGGHDRGYEGHGGGAAGSTLNNCTLTGNSARFGGGAYSCALNNCTLTGNNADAIYFDTEDGDTVRIGGYGGGTFGSTQNNCIVYFNTAPDGANFYSSGTLNYSCTTPLPTNGVGNITNAPLFVDQASGNLRLQSNSPCVNAGLNVFAPAGPDRDGLPRTKGDTVDIGAYEFQSPTSRISYAWLQQYGLPTDGTADNTDPDGDGLNNWQEWRCLTDPTNALSMLRLLSPATGGTNVLVTWQSVAGVNYSLERSTNLTAPATFTPLATNIPGQPGTTTFTHTNASGAGARFYRVGVSTP